MFAGVDIETTGLLPESQVIQVGLHIDGATLRYDIRHAAESLNLSAEALKINGFTLARIVGGISVYDVDAALAAELEARTVEPGSLIPVGWNVGVFDMPRIRAALPHFAKYFHPYRVLDLNSVCFALVGEAGYKAVKNEAQKYAKDNAGEGAEHDAGYDARASILALSYLQEKIKRGG